MLRPAAIIVATLLLAGCSPSEPVIAPAPAPSGTPIFASDEEALEAATEAYAKYLEAADQSLTTYELAALNESAEGKALDSATTKVEKYKSLGQHQIGSILIVSSEPTDLQSVLRAGADRSTVQIYGCLDLSQVNVLDIDGESVVAADRPSYVLVLVSLVWYSGSKEFKVSEEEVWQNAC